VVLHFVPVKYYDLIRLVLVNNTVSEPAVWPLAAATRYSIENERLIAVCSCMPEVRSDINSKACIAIFLVRRGYLRIAKYNYTFASFLWI